MLPQKHRISAEEFDNIFKNGKRIFGENITLHYVQNTPYFKASVVISKKISKKAVERNWQKRVVREVIRQVFLTDKSEKSPYSCLFFIKKKILDIPYEILLNEVMDLSKKIK